MARLLVLIVGFILASGFLAMIDAAILSITRAEVEEMVAHGKSGAVALRALVRRLPRAVVIIVILTSIVNILGPILIGQAAIALFGSRVIGIITALLTLITIIGSEIIPKALGTHYAPVISRLIAPFILGLTVLLYPIVRPLERFVNVLKRGERKIGTEDQIRALVSIGGRHGHIEQSEGQLIQRAFILNDRMARDTMIPWEKVVAIPHDATVRDAADLVLRFPYSRYPVTGASPANILGLALSRDILQALAEGRDEEPIERRLRRILSTDASTRCDRLLLLFRREKVHMAVVKEGSRTLGVVTLEDVLEELVGEIEDETDARRPPPLR